MIARDTRPLKSFRIHAISHCVASCKSGMESVGPKRYCQIQLLHAASTTSKQASTRKMGKNHNSVVVLWILPKFCWMVPMGVREGHTNLLQELTGFGRKM